MNLTDINPMHKEIAKLRERVADLEEEIREFKKIFSPVALLPREWKLSFCEKRMVLALASSLMIKHEAMFRLCSAGRAEISPQISNVVVSHARKKLKPFGIVIQNVRHEGYRLPPESRAIVRAAIERENKPYDADDDMRASVELCLRAVRERKAAGGAGWPRAAEGGAR